VARGYVRQRAKGTWSLTVELEPDPTTGERRQRFETVVGSKKLADERLAALLGEVAGGRLGDAGRMTVAQFLDRWLAEHARPSLTPKTYSNYVALVNNQIIPVLGRVRLEKLRPADVLTFKARLRAMPTKAGRRGKPTAETTRTLSPVRQRQAFVVLKAALKHAVTWRLLTVNPMDGIDAPKATATEMHPWTAQQASAFLAAAAGQSLFWHAFFTVALNTGMRLAELVGLRWADLDVDKGSLRVVQTIAWVDQQTGEKKGGWVVKPPKTAAGRRAIPLGPDLVALLKTHKATQNAHRLTCGTSWHDWDLVFPSLFGTPIQSYRVRDTLETIAGKARVEGRQGPEPVPVIRVHDLRHTAATLLLAAGVPVKVVSERLGHASVLVTMGVYAHVLPGMQEEATATLEGLLRGAGSAGS